MGHCTYSSCAPRACRVRAFPFDVSRAKAVVVVLRHEKNEQEDRIEAERNEISSATKRCPPRPVLVTSRAIAPSLCSPGRLHSRVGTRLYMAESSETASLSSVESAQASCLRAAPAPLFFFRTGPCRTTSRCPGALLPLWAEMPLHPAAPSSDRCGAFIYLYLPRLLLFR